MVRLSDIKNDDDTGLKSKCRACGESTRGNYDMLCGPCWKLVPRAAKDAYLKVWRLTVLYERKTIQELEQAEAELIASAAPATVPAE